MQRLLCVLRQDMNPLTAYLVLTALLGLGIAAFLLPRLRPETFGRRFRAAGIVLLVLAFIGLFTRLSEMLWDGGYQRAEYQITFQDSDGQPVEGIEMRVEDRRGRTFYHYPVTEYLPDSIPTSDRAGVMVFHHAGGGIEFSGRCWFLFGLIPVIERPGPDYVCRFLHSGGEVYRIRFGELDRWEGAERVRRRWRPPDWPMSELLLPNGIPRDDWDARAMRLFDLDGDGKLDPEEGAAYRAGTNWREQEAAIARLKGENPEEREFALVHRSVIIRLRPE